MNILMYVMTMLMLFTMLTYARLETFRSFFHTQKEFEHHMTSTERKTLNDKAFALYNAMRGKRESTDPGKARPPKGIKKLGWSILFDKNKQKEQSLKYQQVLDVSVRLIYSIFRHNHTFIDLVKEDADIVERLLKAIGDAAEERESSQKIRRDRDLESLNLSDPKLNHLFYLLLKGVYADNEKNQQQDKVVRLDDYVTLSNDPLRPYLASQKILLAIYQEQNIVDKICERRTAIYKQLNKYTGQQLEDAKKQYMEEFSDYLQGLSSQLSLEFIDASVTTTQPNNL